MSMFCNKRHKKTPENRSFPGKRITFLALGELGSTTGGLQTVFLALLHTRIAGEETGLLEDGTVVGVDEQQSAGNAMAQSAGLTGHTAALDGGDDINLTEGLGRGEGLTDDHLEGLETEILVDVAAVDGDGAGAVLKEMHAGNGGLSAVP